MVWLVSVHWNCCIRNSWTFDIANYGFSGFPQGVRDSSFGIATHYGLGGPEIESRLEARFSAPVQTGPGAHPTSCKMGTWSFPRVKRPGRGADHPPPSKRRGHERVELYLYSPSGPSLPVIGRSLLTFYTWVSSCFT